MMEDAKTESDSDALVIDMDDGETPEKKPPKSNESESNDKKPPKSRESEPNEKKFSLKPIESETEESQPEDPLALKLAELTGEKPKVKRR